MGLGSRIGILAAVAIPLPAPPVRSSHVELHGAGEDAFRDLGLRHVRVAQVDQAIELSEADQVDHRSHTAAASLR